MKMKWHYDDEIRIKKLKIAPYETNCYIIVCPRSGEGAVVDTPGESNRMLAEVADVSIRYIIITHTHPDHLGAFRKVREKLGVPVAVHSLEAGCLPSPPDISLQDGDVLSFGSVSLRVLHTPGHTPGSICLLCGKHLFSGDTLFPGGPGNTRTPADLAQIVDSIASKLLVLPDETLVYPGHGDDTVLAKEKREFAVFSGKPVPPGLCGDVQWLST
jgi:hydroxyacylglutathione hydrolase